MTPLERARDVTTSAADLRALASSDDPDVRLAVAANPSTPRNAVEVLLRSHDDREATEVVAAVLSNASLPVWLLEDPAWLHHLDHRRAIDMACSLTLSPFLWDLLCTHPEQRVRMAAMLSPMAPPQAWRRFGFATETDALLTAIGMGVIAVSPAEEIIDSHLLADRFLAHPEVPTRLRDDPTWLSRHPSQAHYFLAGSDALTRALWEALCEHESATVKLLLLRSPVAPPDAWSVLGLPTTGTWDLTRQIGGPHLEALACYPIVTSITRLDLGNNLLPDASLQILLRSPSFPGLIALDLSDNEMHTGTVCTLAHSTSFPALEELDLGRGMVRDEGITALARSSHFPHLSRLRLQFCWLTDEGVVELARTTTFRLTLLDLTQNEIDDEPGRCVSDASAIAIAQSPAMAGLTHLDLSWNAITDVGALALTRAPFFPHLASLRLLGCPLSPAGIEALREAAAPFPHLRLVFEREP